MDQIPPVISAPTTCSVDNCDDHLTLINIPHFVCAYDSDEHVEMLDQLEWTELISKCDIGLHSHFQTPNLPITLENAMFSDIESDISDLPIADVAYSNCDIDVPSESVSDQLVPSIRDLTKLSEKNLKPVNTNKELNTENETTPTRLKLKRRVKSLQRVKYRMKKRINALKSSNRYRSVDDKTEILAIDKIVRAASKHLTPLQLELFRCQMIANQRKSKRIVWTVKMKSFSLQLQYKSPSAYKLLCQHFTLPSADTLQKFVNTSIGRLQPGFSEQLMRIVEMRVEELLPSDRQCALVFDEMSLKSQIVFDKHIDKILGYTDRNSLANHALVFMVRGLHAKWKQAVAFHFTHNTVSTPDLAVMITECIQKVSLVGLSIRCVVCDQGATNVAALKSLGFTTELPQISVSLNNENRRIHVIFDVPHLLKNVRNNLQKHNIEFGTSTASWNDIRRFYEIDSKQSIRLAPRLTSRHLNVTSTQKMRVRLAAQTLSHSVSVGMKMLITNQQLPVSAKGTAEFAEKIDTIFALLNSRVRISDRPARCAVTNQNDNLRRLDELKTWISSWKFKGTRSQSAIKCHWGLLVSIASVNHLCTELLQEGFTFICTSRFNQDCIENFFSVIRGKNGWHENPNCVQFASAFRNAVVLSSLDRKNSGKNCIDDGDFVLINHADMIHYELSNQDACCATRLNADAAKSNDGSTHSSYSTRQTDHDYCASADAPTNHSIHDDEHCRNGNSPIQNASVLNNSQCLISLCNAEDNLWVDVSDTNMDCDIECAEEIVEQFTESEECLVTYLSGWVARKSAICTECQLVLTKPAQEHSYYCRPIDLFVSMKHYKESCSYGLINPCDELFAVVHFLEQQFRTKFKQYMLRPLVVKSLFEAIYPSCDFSFLFMRHAEHALILSEKITKMFLTMRIFYAVKFMNRELETVSSNRVGDSVRRSSTKRKMQKITHV